MNNLQVFEEMIPRHKALLAEHWGCCTLEAAPQRPRSWLAHVQNWLSENIALYRTTAPNP
jgi:hypothetical protein